MTDSHIVDLVQRIHDTSTKACLVITGAGTSAISSLFSVAGASRTVIDAQVPYSRAALDKYVGVYVGVEAEQHVSREEAEIMAAKAQARAVMLSETMGDSVRLVGLSCTAAIATDRVRRGENRAHIGWHDGTSGVTRSIVFSKGARSRSGEETLCAAIMLNALAEACGVDDELELDLLEGEFVERCAH